MNRGLTFLVLLCACAQAKAPFTRTTASRPLPKERGCAFEILSTLPLRPFEEIGTFAIEGTPSDPIDQEPELRNLVGTQACREGTDALLVLRTADGVYTSARAIRWKPETGPAPAPGPAPAGDDAAP